MLTLRERQEQALADKIEKVARALCASVGYDPDQLEPGDRFGIDGRMPNGDPAHKMWRSYADRAEVLIFNKKVL
jgi:hypothetical protein